MKEKNNNINNISVKWSTDIGEEIQKYKHANKVFLEKNNELQKDILKKVEDIFNKMHIKNSIELENILEKNLILKLDEQVNFSIRNMNYQLQEKFNIIDCVIIFLYQEKTEQVDFYNNKK